MESIIYNFYLKNGLYFTFPNNESLIIDGTNSKVPPKTKSIVSHAHSDHFGIMNTNIPTYATQETIDLFLCQKKSVSRENFHPVSFNQNIPFNSPIPDFDIQLLPSGHILGSASVSINHEGKKVLFSSDIGGKGLLTVNKPMQKVSSEILIIEATFGSPEINFPPREEISMDILKWTTNVIKEKRNVVISTGKIGSAQELIKLFNNFTSLRIITHGDVTPPTEIYKKYNVKLESFDSKSEEGREIIKDGDAIIIQSRSKKIIPFFLKEHINYRSAIVTGMASRFSYKDYDISFPLSSHASYKEIIEYVNDVSPELVFTIYGFEERLAKAITHVLKIPAVPLKAKDQYNATKKLSNQRGSLIATKKVIEDNSSQIITQNDKEMLKKEYTLDDFFNSN